MRKQTLQGMRSVIEANRRLSWTEDEKKAMQSENSGYCPNPGKVVVRRGGASGSNGEGTSAAK